MRVGALHPAGGTSAAPLVQLWGVRLSSPTCCACSIPELLPGAHPRAARGPGRSLTQLLFPTTEDERQRSANHKVEMLSQHESKFISPCDGGSAFRFVRKVSTV